MKTRLLLTGMVFGILTCFGIIIFNNWSKPKKITYSKVLPTQTATPTVLKNEKSPQFVLLSFDGSESMPMWEATRKFAQEMKAQGKSLHFTYFVSGVYFLTDKNKNYYQGPGQQVGVSKIGFGRDEEDVAKRIEEVRLAQSEGHEIASHLNGHFDGTNWGERDWRSEIEQFRKLVPISGIVGIRTPLLARNKYLYAVLKDFGFSYDSSSTGKSSDWPVKNEYGTWEIPLVTITLPEIRKSTLSMDYNLYLTQTGGRDVLKKGTKEWESAYRQVLGAYRNYYANNYQNSRAPIVIGNHFSQWNNGVYWEAMKTLANEVCDKPDVKCSTFSELVQYLEKQPLTER